MEVMEPIVWATLGWLLWLYLEGITDPADELVHAIRMFYLFVGYTVYLTWLMS